MTREEAIKILSERYSSALFSERTALETLIPELKESKSEYERIRKAIVRLIEDLQQSDKNFDGVELADMLAWLENHNPSFKQISDGIIWDSGLRTGIELGKKQQEQKPAEFDEYKIIKKHITEDSLSSEVNKRLTECGWYVTDKKPIEWTELTWKDVNELEEIMNEVRSDYRGGGIGQKSFGLEVLERFRYIKGDELDVKEQKPEWSEEDERMLSRCIKSVECSKQFADSETYKAAKDVEMNWLKSLPERFNLQPKREWNGDDNVLLNNIINIIQNKKYVNDDAARKKYVDFLKSIRPQPKAELTLLDENIIKAAVAFVEQNDHFNCWGGIDKHTVIKALRSLKSHQKSAEWSEEDEEMRKSIIWLLRVTYPSYRKEVDWLKSLQPQVKQEQNTLEYLPKEKIYHIANELINLSLSGIIPIESEGYTKIVEIKSNVLKLLDYPTEKKQEQIPVDLEKEMDKYYGMYRDKAGETYDIEDDEPCFDWKEDELSENKMRMARHFYELGLKARKDV